VTILLGIRADNKRNSVQRFLKRHGHEVISVATAKDVANLLGLFQVVVTEAEFPDGPVDLNHPHIVLYHGKKNLLKAISTVRNPWRTRMPSDSL
jgi:hypothetical protein